MTEQPHEVLERAAYRLEELTFGLDADRYWRLQLAESNLNDAAENWGNTMSPAVAAPLARWLRSDAEQLKIATVGLSPERALWFERERYAGALAFARMVLGEAT